MNTTYTVDKQPTDAMAQSTVEVLGDSPALGMGNLLGVSSQALSNSAHNSSFAQQQAWATMQTATIQSVNSLFNQGTGSTGKAATEILRSSPPKGKA